VPTIKRIAGNRFFFFSKENDEPVHIHIENADKHAKFWLEPEIKLARSNGYSAVELNKLRKLIEDNHLEFKEEWYEFFNHN